jgi:hypothetical protein
MVVNAASNDSAASRSQSASRPDKSKLYRAPTLVKSAVLSAITAQIASARAE